MDYGLAVTVNTDNTTVSNTTITKELECLVKYQNFDIEDIKKVTENGINFSFASAEDKLKLHAEYSSFINNL